MSKVRLCDIELTRPRCIQQACEELARCKHIGRKAWAVAGCTDWMVDWNARHVDDDCFDGLVVDISLIPELRGIVVDGDDVSIGAAEPYSSLVQHRVIRDRCGLLSLMADGVGSPQVRSRGTLGGNLVSGSPAADGVTALFALDADVVLRSVRGQRRIPITSFYAGYRLSVRSEDELLERVEFRMPRPDAFQLWRKVGSRKSLAISKVSVAAIAEIDDQRVSRIGFGVASVADRVLPLSAARSLLLGTRIGSLSSIRVLLIDAIDREISPIDDIRSTAKYRRHVAKVLVWAFVCGLRQELDRDVSAGAGIE